MPVDSYRSAEVKVQPFVGGGDEYVIYSPYVLTLVKDREAQGQLKLIRELALHEVIVKGRGSGQHDLVELLKSLGPHLKVQFTSCTFKKATSQLFFLFLGNEDEVIAKINAIPIKKWHTPQKKVCDMIYKAIQGVNSEIDRYGDEAFRRSRGSVPALSFNMLKDGNIRKNYEWPLCKVYINSKSITKLEKLIRRNDVGDTLLKEAWDLAQAAKIMTA